MDIRLSSPMLDFHVDVRLDRRGGGWVAAAEIGGQRQYGVGGSARQALSASLSSLERGAVAVLLADPGLFGPSRQLLVVGAG